MKKLIFAYFRDPAYCDNLVNRDAKKIDYLNYSFAKIINGELSVNHLNNLKKVVELKKQGLKVIIVVDGVSDETRKAFSEVSSTKESREKFACSVLKVIEEYNLDGIDLDWEYPTGDKQRGDFTLLCQCLREKFNENNKKYLLTAAIGSAMYDEHYEIKKLTEILDFIHIMTYGSGGKKKACHHSPVYLGNGYTHNVYDSVMNCLKSGAHPDKLTFGIPFYVRMGEFKLENENDEILGHDYNPDTFRNIGYSKFLKEHCNKDSFKEYYDNSAHAYYSYDGEIFASYDNSAIIKEKCELAKKLSLAGLMFWDYGHDKESGILLETLYENLKK